jgi:hypothetical protein
MIYSKKLHKYNRKVFRNNPNAKNKEEKKEDFQIEYIFFVYNRN